MVSKLGKVFGRSYTLVWMVLIGALLFWIYFPVLLQYFDLKAREEALNQRIATLEEEIEELLIEERRLLGDVDYLEKLARDELGLAKPGEVVFKQVSKGGDSHAVDEWKPPQVPRG